MSGNFEAEGGQAVFPEFEIDPDARRWPKFMRVFNRPLRPIPYHNLRSNLRFFAGVNRFPLFLGVILVSFNYLAGALMPKLMGMGLDAGLHNPFSAQFWWIIGGMLLAGVGMLISSFYQYVEIGLWMGVSGLAVRDCGRRTSVNSSAITRKMAPGDAINVVNTDCFRIPLLNFLIELVVATLTVIGIGIVMLYDSVPLGLFVLIGLPITMYLMTLIVKPLQKRNGIRRDALGELTTLATDAVTGLRILRGIGGESQYVANYRRGSQKVLRAGFGVATMNSILAGMRVALPGIFTAGVLWLGAVYAVRGDITPGQLVTYYGYTAYLQVCLSAMTTMVEIVTGARVALGKIHKLYSVPMLLDENPGPARAPLGQATFTDTATGMVIAPGRTTAVVCADPSVSAAAALRLARIAPPERPVLVDGVDLAEYPLAQIRAEIAAQANAPDLFTGTLRANVSRDTAYTAPTASREDLLAFEADVHTARSVHGPSGFEPAELPDDQRWLDALHVADCGDVLTSIPGGLSGQISERGRSISGGQRQRVAVARAVATDAPVLVLVEPTSAVDSHTESRVAKRLHAARAGKTTVIVTSSPIVLDQVDQVVFIDSAGRALPAAAHDELLKNPAYRRVVVRATGEEQTPGEEPAAAGAAQNASESEAR